MAASDSIAQLGGWEGYEVEASWGERRGAPRWYVVRLRARPRRVRDLPLFEASVELLLPRLRVACRHCGPAPSALYGSTESCALPWEDTRDSPPEFVSVECVSRRALQHRRRHGACRVCGQRR